MTDDDIIDIMIRASNGFIEAEDSGEWFMWKVAFPVRYDVCRARMRRVLEALEEQGLWITTTP